MDRKNQGILKPIMDGLYAGSIMTIIVSIWSIVLSIDTGIDGWTFLDFLLFSLSIFGMVGLPTLLFGIAVGSFFAIWRGEITGSEDAKHDAVLSSKLATALILVPMSGVVVGAMHYLITSKFVRPTFQALGLVILTIVVGFSLLGIGPLVDRIVGKVLSVVGFKPDKYYLATRKILIIAVVGYVISIILGSYYATTLNLWDAQLIWMLGLLLLGVPSLFIVIYLKRPEEFISSPAWLVAGFVLALSLFTMAAYTTSRSAATRTWITETPAIVGLQARVLRNVADGDRDGFAATWGGNDCNDNDPTIYPGAPDKPGDGIDQSCSGADAILIIDHVGPAIQIVGRAATMARSAAQQAAEKTPEPPKNIVMILVDTLRMDHTGFGGYHRETTPSLDALASKSSVFLNAYATSPHTPRSIPAIFLSRYASKTKWRGAQYNYPRVLPENLSVFTVLQNSGWDVFGFSSHHYFDEKRGLSRGFNSWDNEGAKSIAESNDDIAAPRIWEKLEPELEKLGEKQKEKDAKPFALFVHFFEPHARWINHDKYTFENDGSTESKHIANYDSEIRFVDDYVGKVVQKLKETGLEKETIIVIVADHGEGFNEHGYFFHGQTLYNEAIHVPIIIHVPGWKPNRIETPVSIIDIAPTLLNLEKLPIPQKFEGESLVPMMLNGDEKDAPVRPIFAELLPYTAWKEHHKAVIMGNMKLIHVLSKGTQELYDLKEDPKEKTNLIQDKERAKPLQEALNRFMSSDE